MVLRALNGNRWVFAALIAGYSVLYLGVGAGDTVRVFGLQEDSWKPPRNDVYIKYDFSKRNDLPDNLTHFSVCYWVKYAQLAGSNVHFSYATSYPLYNSIQFGFMEGFYFSTLNNINLALNIALHNTPKINNWSHFCHLYNSSHYAAYENGVKIFDAIMTRWNNSLVLLMNGTLIIGQDQNYLSGGFTAHDILRGNIAQFSIFEQLLSETEILDLASCSIIKYQPIVSTEDQTLVIVNASENILHRNHFCSAVYITVMFLGERTFSDAYELCTFVGGTLFAPTTMVKNELLFEVASDDNTCPFRNTVWLGITDHLEENVWRNVVDNTTSESTFFKNVSYIGSTNNNCATLRRPEPLWRDVNCLLSLESCAPCDVSSKKHLRLKGYCFNNEVESFFEVTGYVNSRAYFHGYTGLMIYSSDSSARDWVLYDSVIGKILANISLPLAKEYPIGKNIWTANEKFCGFSKYSEQILILSSCGLNEFTCDNFRCIDVEKYCDGTSDCNDSSDENYCHHIEITEKYNSFRPPAIDMNGLMMMVDVEIIRFIAFDDVKHIAFVELELFFQWKDTRLVYLNLDESMYKNVLNEFEIQSIRTPEVAFPSVYNGDIVEIGEQILITRDGTKLPTNHNTVIPDNVYNGSSAYLIYRRQLSGKFGCKFDVYRYPFDEHRCKLVLQLASSPRHQVSFSDECLSLHYHGDINLVNFEVRNMSINAVNISRKLTVFSGLTIEIYLVRLSNVVMVTVFLPILLLLTISFSTLYIRVEYLEARLVVAVTALLVLYTLFSRTTDALPQTAYVLMIEIWFLTFICLLSLIIIAHVVVEYVDQYRASNCSSEIHVMKINNTYGGASKLPRDSISNYQNQAIKKTFRFVPQQILPFLRSRVFPAIFIVFNVIFWIYWLH